MSDDIFADDYIPMHKRSGRSIDQILEDISSNKDSKKTDRWQKNTRKPSKAGPETKVKVKIRKHLEEKYNAKVIRTNAGKIVDQYGNTIWLGETGQSDLQAITPIIIDGFTFGIFSAFEIKADNDEKHMNYQKAYLGLIPSGKSIGLSVEERKHLIEQQKYIDYIKSRGGIGCFVWSIADVDTAILKKMLEIQMKFASR